MKKFVLFLSLLLAFGNLVYAEEKQGMLPSFGSDLQKSYNELKQLPIEAYIKDEDGYIKPKISRDGVPVCPDGYKRTTVNYIVRCAAQQSEVIENNAAEQNLTNTKSNKTLLNTAGTVGVGALKMLLSK